MIPVAMIGTREIQPAGQKIPNVRRVGIRIGKPLGLLALRGHGERPLRAAVHDRRDHVRTHGAVRPRSTSTSTPPAPKGHRRWRVGASRCGCAGRLSRRSAHGCHQRKPVGGLPCNSVRPAPSHDVISWPDLPAAQQPQWPDAAHLEQVVLRWRPCHRWCSPGSAINSSTNWGRCPRRSVRAHGWRLRRDLRREHRQLHSCPAEDRPADGSRAHHGSRMPVVKIGRMAGQYRNHDQTQQDPR